MQKSSFPLLTILALCFVIACLTSAANVLVVVLGAADIGRGMPFTYYEQLNFSLISIAVPIAGMLLLTISAPVLLRQRETTTATAVTESVAQPEAAQELEPVEAYPKAA
jgi:hypothetical protein